jgi:hypothetical protein
MPDFDRQAYINNCIEPFRSQLIARIFKGKTLDESVGAITREETAMNAVFPLILELRMEALDTVSNQIRDELTNVRYLSRHALRWGRADWYAGPDGEARIWPALKRRLLQVKGRKEEEVAVVDSDSNAVVSLLSNPGIEEFRDRGLVIGHVQSGKTGNMAAVIAKAADTPYKFFVVLSGMTDVLRHQTQIRIDEDIINNGNPEIWHPWTDSESDFMYPSVGGFPLDGPRRHIAVIKKNAGILRRFINKLRQTPLALRQNTPFLIIDDECDQASVNANGLQKRVTAINRLIRLLIKELPRVTYVGYTATPFANVLIDPNAMTAQLDSDLYPRDFIYPLCRPKAYFGAVELFGREALEGESMEDSEELESGYDMIRIVPDKESECMRPGSAVQAGSFVFPITESLDAAIRYFILVTSARRVRGQQDEHSTMLVHTSMLNVIHQAAKSAISTHVAMLQELIRSGDTALLSELERLWVDESMRVPSGQFGNIPVSFGELSPHLQSSVEAIDIKVENYISQDRIDYRTPGRKYIVIGGNVLARGLTLEGLMVSYFLRTASQYDTLMQMGRWFGYRPGFEEFPRVWMESWVRDAFFDLATVEEEMRRSTRRYADDNVTPMDYALPIRLIAGLSPTAASKMRNGVRMQIGYAGEHRQTIKFRRYDKNWLQGNWVAGAALLAAKGDIRTVRSNKVKFAVHSDDVIAFINHYVVHDMASMRRDLLVQYIQMMNGNNQLGEWNVVVIGSGNGRDSRIPLGSAGHVRCVTRAPLRDSGDIAFIKALMSRQDLFADCDVPPAESGNWSWDDIKKYRHAKGMRPMLILYPISADSIPAARSSTSREPMQALMDVLGVGIVFPGSPGAGLEYIHADIRPADAEDGAQQADPLPDEDERGGDPDAVALPEEMNNANE